MFNPAFCNCSSSNHVFSPAANRGGNAQPKFDPHFVSAPEATPLRPAKKAAPAPQTAAKAAPANNKANNGQNDPNGRRNAPQNANNNRPARNSRPERRPQSSNGAANTQPNGGKARTERSDRSAMQSSSRAPRTSKPDTSRRGSRNAVGSRDEDPGLVLISRRPPQQKFTNFEEYMTAHGGATAPIEDHSDEV